MAQAINFLGETVAPASQPEQPADTKDPQRIVARWTEGAAEWGQRADGHLVVISYGDVAPGAGVRAHLPGVGYRNGTVERLIPGIGPAPRPVIATVRMDPTPGKEPPRKPINARFDAADLVVTRAQRKQVNA